MSDSSQSLEVQASEKKGVNRIVMFGIWAFVLSLVMLIAWGLINNSGTRPLAGDPAPNFTIYFYDGYEWQDAPNEDLVELVNMRGQIVVLNFWASWCPPCHEEAEDLERLWQKYRDRDVIFLGIAYVDTEPNALGFLDRYNITYPNGPDIQTMITDKFLVKQLPETFVIDRNGKVVFVEPGPIDVNRLKNVLNQLTTTQ
ncbi:MAG: TlpA family protein disulfide reductase [Anaerolineales bacterium]|nr:TlpA family protein disulfide reductase [Anaerolineales bacterium]